MAVLFEYGKWVLIEPRENTKALKELLKDIWRQSKFVDTDAELTEDERDNQYQPFLKFDEERIRANNYVGFIQYREEVIEIYPKVFRERFLSSSEKPFKKLMLQHLFYWLRYYRKLKFPFNKVALEPTSIDNFPDLIINLMSSQILETISNQPLAMYQELKEAMATPRGSINFKRYIANSLSYGNFQNIECDYEPFLYDNTLNRIIKYCSRLLMNQTRNPENLRLLQNVIFILDRVLIQENEELQGLAYE